MNLRKLDFVVLTRFPVGLLREPAPAKCGDSSNGVKKERRESSAVGIFSV